jgi:hypothetical protein
MQCVLSVEILCNTGKPTEITPQKFLKIIITRNMSVKVTCTGTHNIAVFEAIHIHSFTKSPRGRLCRKSRVM